MVSPQIHETNELFHEDISEYVAELQLHMTLQARNLVPSFPEWTVPEQAKTQPLDSRVQLLQESQANIEKLVSRQEILSCRL
ncbi:hypothetical protein [Spirulina sp. 06S082]|uniref:hypothetical protein n=1 Tax=Spirulina sp. 06S082 TaxID=3110248 RepID=UPI002B1FA172|nr:hypothetical protein [Spirulina sp. 06S082]MEA5468349.1 hypothetical protein [Spirulina sp. 06S082]